MGAPSTKDDNIWQSILGSPTFGPMPFSCIAAYIVPILLPGTLISQRNLVVQDYFQHRKNLQCTVKLCQTLQLSLCLEISERSRIFQKLHAKSSGHFGWLAPVNSGVILGVPGESKQYWIGVLGNIQRSISRRPLNLRKP